MSSIQVVSITSSDTHLLLLIYCSNSAGHTEVCRASILLPTKRSDNCMVTQCHLALRYEIKLQYKENHFPLNLHMQQRSPSAECCSWNSRPLTESLEHHQSSHIQILSRVRARSELMIIIFPLRLHLSGILHSSLQIAFGDLGLSSDQLVCSFRET
jgi:hypothetical protein